MYLRKYSRTTSDLDSVAKKHKITQGMRQAERSRTVRDHQLATVLPSVWRRLKRDNEIDRKYASRARKIEIGHRIFYPGHLLQSALYKNRLRRISFEGHPPVFILGLWRSGTTHLHYMLSRDPRKGYLKNHQAFTFNMSLLSKDRLNKALNIFVPKRRPQDNVKLTLDDPAEEEQPFSTITTRSSIHSFFFPKNQSYFERYHLFEGISSQEQEAWAREYLFLLKNISFYTCRRDLVLKNPHNTGRIKALLDLFPDAKFIFLHRDPYRVFHSTRRLYDKMVSTQFLQYISEEEIEDLIIDQNRRIMQKYIQDRDLIPSGNLLEISFEQLEEQPMEIVEEIYRKLDQPGFEDARTPIRKYLESVRDYRKNRYSPISKSISERIETEWSDWFDAFGYRKG